MFFEHPVYIQTSYGELEVKDLHFQLFTVAKTSKLALIQNFNAISKEVKKNQIFRKRLEVRMFSERPKMLRITFCFQ